MHALDYDQATGTITIALAGNCAASSRRQILDDVAGVVSLYGVREVAVDMSGVTAFDADALDAVLAAQRICRSQGKRFSLRDPSPLVIRILRATFADVELLRT
ncbi:MAG: hypothetical protein JWN20_2553 [Jatrophihabitantaceae bacterium]|nr:hypothetical protein [Jatrophihabitantaceae bacterium]